MLKASTGNVSALPCYVNRSHKGTNGATCHLQALGVLPELAVITWGKVINS